jgi:hypothetical protein
MKTTSISPSIKQVETSRPRRKGKSLSRIEREQLFAPLYGYLKTYLDCEAEILSQDPDLEITRFVKAEGPLTKRISLHDGKPVSDGSTPFASRANANLTSSSEPRPIYRSRFVSGETKR